MYRNYEAKERQLKREIEALRDRYNQQEAKLVKLCTQRGGHEDNGGFMHGLCTRCGVCLG